MGSAAKFAIPAAMVGIPFMFPGVGAAMGIGAAGRGAGMLSGITGPELFNAGTAASALVPGGQAAISGANMGFLSGLQGLPLDKLGALMPQGEETPPMMPLPVAPPASGPPSPQGGGSLAGATSRDQGPVPLHASDVFAGPATTTPYPMNIPLPPQALPGMVRRTELR